MLRGFAALPRPSHDSIELEERLVFWPGVVERIG
jgi:hypothetical protein